MMPHGAHSRKLHVALTAALVFVYAGCTRTIAPEILSFHAPEQVALDTAAVFTARINESATEPVRLRWDFGTGYEDHGLRMRYVFPSAGVHTVRFRVENKSGYDMRTWKLRVGDPEQTPRIATVRAEPNPVQVGEPVHYAARIAGPVPDAYAWTFGDGEQSAVSSPTHRYGTPGIYAVSVQVQHPAGTDVRTVQVEVNPVMPDFCTPPIEGNRAYFARNASMLTNAAREVLRENVKLFQDCAALSVTVEAQAAAYERIPEALAADRAATVVAFYQEAGVDPSRIRAAHQVVGTRDGAESPKGGKSPKEAEAAAQSVGSAMRQTPAP